MFRKSVVARVQGGGGAFMYASELQWEFLPLLIGGTRIPWAWITRSDAKQKPAKTELNPRYRENG